MFQLSSPPPFFRSLLWWIILGFQMEPFIQSVRGRLFAFLYLYFEDILDCLDLALTLFRAVTWHSYWTVVCLLQYLDLRGLPLQVFAYFSRTKFIAWDLRCPIRGIPMGSRIFSPAAHESQFMCCPYHKTVLCHSLTQWDVR